MPLPNKYQLQLWKLQVLITAVPGVCQSIIDYEEQRSEICSVLGSESPCPGPRCWGVSVGVWTPGSEDVRGVLSELGNRSRIL